MSSKSLFGKENVVRALRSKPAKFIAAGLVNTGSTYLLYLALLRFLDYQASYAISYVAGIALAYVLNSKIVFRSAFAFIRMVFYPLIYVFQYLANAGLLNLFVGRLGMKKQIAPLLAICLTMPVVFLLNRIVLTSELRRK